MTIVREAFRYQNKDVAPVACIKYDDGDMRLRIGELVHFCVEVDFTPVEWAQLIRTMREVAETIDPDATYTDVDPEEELCYYGDSEIDPNPPEED